MAGFEISDKEKGEVNSCPEFPYFGAWYPDATCIEGKLWDSDSYEEGLGLTIGGEDPCPFCNTEAYLESQSVGDPEGPTRGEVLAEIEILKAKYG